MCIVSMNDIGMDYPNNNNYRRHNGITSSS